MQEPSHTADKEQRQAILTSLCILDTPPVEELNVITKLAAQFFGVKIAVISLIEIDRQWFLSRFGLELTETARKTSFCGHTILYDGPFIIPDARQDVRFFDNPAVAGPPYISCYAGYPLRSKQGINLGAFCIADDKPRQFSIADIEALRGFAAIVQNYLQTLESHVYTAKIENDLAYTAALFEQAFAQAAVGFALVSPDGHWERVNQRACAMLGYSEKTLLNKTFQEITHPDDLDADLNLVNQLISGKISTYSIEKRYLTANGSILWAMLTVSLIRTPDGQPKFFVSVLNDISERKKAESALQRLQYELEERISNRTQELQIAVGQLNREIEQRIQTQNWLRQQKEYFRTTLQKATDAIIEIDDTGKITRWNHSAERSFGWTSQEAMQLAMENVLSSDVFSSNENENFEPCLIALKKEKDPYKRLQLTVLKKDGGHIPVEMTITENWMEDRRFVTLFLQDISERRQREQALRESEQRLHAIADNVPALISHVDQHERYTYINRPHEKWFGILEDKIKGMTVQQVLGEETYSLAAPLIQKVLQGQIEEFEFKINLPDKNSRILHTVLIPCDNKQDGFYGLSTDITELKLLQSHLEYEANHDVLTGLPNRRAFLRDLSEATMDLEKSMEGMAVLFMDIDDFKFYNDSYGHEFGDLVLKTFARMLKKSILEKNSVARLAGDESTIILTRLADPEKEVKTIVEKIATELKNIEKIAGVNLRLSASIGIGIAHAKEKILPHTLLTKADNAMYQAKMSGKGMHAIN